MAYKGKNPILLMIILAVGIVIGGVLGEVFGDIIPLLSRSYPIGLDKPLHLDLGVIDLTFGLLVDINLASAIGLIISLIIYKKM